MERRDHHDWASEAYVEAWIQRQLANDPGRAERFQLMGDLLPFPADAQVTVLDIGAGYGPVSKFLLDRFPHATCIAQDGSTPMLQHAQQRMTTYGARFRTHQSDLFAQDWLPPQPEAFEVVVSALCLHNLRDFSRISTLYRDIRARLKPGGMFLNLDLVNAPTLGLQQHYGRVTEARRSRDVPSDHRSTAPGHQELQTPPQSAAHAFPADLSEHLAALRAAGFLEVDCFWKDLRQALYGGYVG